jgi:hypothetical protein
LGRLVVVQQAMSNRAAAGVDGTPTATAADDPAPVGENQWPPPPPGLTLPQVHTQPHGQARQAEAVRHQIQILHRLATPSAATTASPRPGTPILNPSAATATTLVPARSANPFTFSAPGYRPQVAQAQQVHPQYWQQATQPQMMYPGPWYGPGPGWPQGSGQGFGYQPNAPYGAAQFAWTQSQQGDGARQPIRIPALALPVLP